MRFDFRPQETPVGFYENLDLEQQKVWFAAHPVEKISGKSPWTTVIVRFVDKDHNLAVREALARRFGEVVGKQILHYPRVEGNRFVPGRVVLKFQRR